MSVAALRLEDFDATTAPTEDLFRHVNGGWLAHTEIPEDKGAFGAFELLREKSDQAVREIITTLEPDAGDPDAEVSKVANLFHTFMDEAAADTAGVAPLAPLLARVEAIESLSDFARWLGWALRHGLGGLFDFDTDADPGDPQRYVLFIGQDGIGLPDEEYYRLDEHAETRSKYLAHLERMLARIADPNPAANAQAVFGLETAIAKHHWDKVRCRDVTQMYYPQTWADFTATMPHFDWEAFLEGAGLRAAQFPQIINANRTFLPEIDPLLSDVSLATWKAWARWNIIDALAPYLDTATAEANFDFYGRTLQGVPVNRERWKRGVSFAQRVMGEAIGKLYVARHFPPAVKARMDELVANLLAAYRSSIAALNWMGEDTKREALKKLAGFRPKIGYPNKWRDYSALKVIPGDLVNTVLAAEEFHFDFHINQLVEPVDPDEWFMFPQTVNAYYHPMRNEIVFPAAILQPPFFNPDADDAVNYGGIGAVIGHEIGHGFDDQGSEFDGDGNLRDWWSETDHAEFKKLTSGLVAQYTGLHPAEAPEVSVNGELTLGENIGDLGGLGIAYQAWLLANGGVAPTDTIDGFTPTQRLFLSWAAVWQTKMRPEARAERVATDPHSPEEFRCNVTVRNVAAFHEAFGTKPGDGMWLDPAARIRIW
ncbi:MAG: peptidase M13 [Propionibacteriaceae bacterium]|jgi:putative endopeptidase|nr:peptidase M13 [Propionibacteriaceae bacterium]